MNATECRQLRRVKRYLRDAVRALNEAAEDVMFATTEFDAGRYDWEDLASTVELARHTLELIADTVKNTIQEVPLAGSASDAD